MFRLARFSFRIDDAPEHLSSENSFLFAIFMTLYGWMKSDPFFRAAFNVWQQELRQSVRDQLLKLADDGVNAIVLTAAAGGVYGEYGPSSRGSVSHRVAR